MEVSLSESAILQVGVKTSGIPRLDEIDAVEYVKKIDPEFKVYALSNLSDFLYGEVGVSVSRISKLVRRFISLLSERR